MEKIPLNIPLRRQIRNMGRFAQIVNVFARHGYWTFLERMEMRKVLSEQELEEATSISSSAEPIGTGAHAKIEGIPTRLRKAFEELGPAFVKLGQVLAVREDLIPKEITEELRRLHNKVETLPYDVIKSRLTEDLGQLKIAKFKSIDPQPLAAGSIAQVHSAILHDGTKVVVKIQRPGIKQLIETDLDLMLTIAELMERYIPESRFLRPSSMVQALADSLISELDFIREAGSMSKMAANFSDVPHVHFPEVFWELTTSKILTLSHVDGLPADGREQLLAAGIDVSLLMHRGMGMFLKMVFIDGFFHGDLHPGNILAMKDSEIGLLDFGSVIRLSARVRENLAGLLLCLAKEDFEGMVNHYLEIADPAANFDIFKFQHEVANALSPFVGLNLKQTQSGARLWDLARIAAKHNTPFPQDLIVFVKSMSTFEGVGMRLDPDFDIMALVSEFAGDIMTELYSPKKFQDQALAIGRDVANLLRHAPFQTRRLLNAALDGQLKINVNTPDVLRLTRSIDRTGSRLSVAVILGALLIGSSILSYASASTEAKLGVVGTGGFVVAGLLAIYIVVSIMRSGRF
jgi:ubiquinone biosynthesis protein